MRPRKALAGIDAGTTRLLAALMRKPPSWAVRLYRSSPIESERAATSGRLEEAGVTRQILIVPGTAKYDSQFHRPRVHCRHCRKWNPLGDRLRAVAVAIK